jgi:hypothetical protein
MGMEEAPDAAPLIEGSVLRTSTILEAHRDIGTQWLH